MPLIINPEVHYRVKRSLTTSLCQQESPFAETA